MTPTGTGGRCDCRAHLAMGRAGTGCCCGPARNPRAWPARGLGQAGGITGKNGASAGRESAGSNRKQSRCAAGTRSQSTGKRL
nr:MAG TPA: hypothetical protein [Caudoviricetes sp.]